MEKIVVAYIGQDVEKVIEMSLKSVKGADAIVFLDGGSKDKTKEIAKKYVDEFLHNKYNKIDKMMNGKQRNIYLNFVKMWLLEIECFLLLNNPHDYRTLHIKSETSQHYCYNIFVPYNTVCILCRALI